MFIAYDRKAVVGKLDKLTTSRVSIADAEPTSVAIDETTLKALLIDDKSDTWLQKCRIRQYECGTLAQ
jgi:hypothetical protein